MSRVQCDLQHDGTAHGPAHEDHAPRPPPPGEPHGSVDVAPLRRAESVGPGSTARRLAVVAVGRDQGGDPEGVEHRDGAEALAAGRAPPVHLDHPEVALIRRREEPRRARTHRGADQLGGERKLQLLGSGVVPAAEGGFRRDARADPDVGEQLPLDGVAVLSEHGAELHIRGRAIGEEAVATGQRRVRCTGQRDRLGGGVERHDLRVGDATGGRHDLPGDPHRQDAQDGEHAGQTETDRDDRGPDSRRERGGCAAGLGAPGIDHRGLTLVCPRG